MMELLLVHFPDSLQRPVKINSELNGWTEELIWIEAGTYTISLEPPPNFTPAERTVSISCTSVVRPFRVTFERV